MPTIRYRSGTVRVSLTLFSASFPKREGHSRILGEGRILCRRERIEGKEKCKLDDSTGCKGKDGERHEIFLRVLREFLFPELEIGVDHDGIKAHPGEIDECLDGDVEEQVVDGIYCFPCDIEAEGKQRHGVGFIPESLPDASDIYD